jgi:hypothetical protein
MKIQCHLCTTYFIIPKLQLHWLQNVTLHYERCKLEGEEGDESHRKFKKKVGIQNFIPYGRMEEQNTHVKHWNI